MKTAKEVTVETYEGAAKELAAYFDRIGIRKHDVHLGIGLTGKPNPRVVEIGCGNGRDAEEILKFAGDYVGIDISGQMVALAKERNPGARFEVGDLADYQIPERTDLIFSFASILHSDREEVGQFLGRAGASLSEGGILYISTKEGSYGPQIKCDEFGARTFFLYEYSDLLELAPDSLEPHSVDFQNIDGTRWFTLILRKDEKS